MPEAKALTDSTTLHNGVKMPWLGLGVWQVPDGQVVEDAVVSALQTGYRSIDTAAIYRNEAGVGRALAASGVGRDEVFVTTKVWNTDQGYDTTLRAFEASMDKLGLEVLDLYLIHWPLPGESDKFKETYRALEQLYNDGRVRAIGVSNFHIQHLEELLSACKVKPMVNQVELHPLLSQRNLRAYCAEQGIQIEAWSPLMQGALDNEVLSAIAAAHGKSPAQVVLRWHLQNGIVAIPKSVRASRIAENADIFDFALSDADMQQIDGLNADKRFGRSPDDAWQ